jgi:hypothetical protein
MNNTNLELGKIKIRNNNGIVAIFQDSIVSIDNYVIYADSLSKIKLIKDAPVFFINENIGKVNNWFYSQITKKLVLFFNIQSLEHGIEIESKIDYFSVVPQIDCSEVICPICNNIFRKGQTSCLCIYESEILILKKINILGIKICDITNYDIYASKNSMLRNFFSGSLNNIIITDPI